MTDVESPRWTDGREMQDALDGAARGAAAQASAENFPVALRVLPARPRDLLARAYTFARFVDDVGDRTPGGPTARLAMLDQLDADIDALPHGARLAPVAGMAPLVTDSGVPTTLLHDLVEANRRDQRTAAYPDFAALLDYCRFSADPIGRIVLHIAGATTPANLADSDRVCSALQVLEHCQDVGEDAVAGRVYLPAEDLTGVDASELTATTTSDALRGAISIQVARADRMLADGRPLVRRLHGWARIAVAGYVAGGLATVDALRRADFAVLESLVTPSRAATGRHALALAAGR